MSQLTPEQRAEFEKYLKTNEGKPYTDETLKGVVTDDIAEKEESLARREGWDRNYNHEPAKIEKRFTREE